MEKGDRHIHGRGELPFAPMPNATNTAIATKRFLRSGRIAIRPYTLTKHGWHGDRHPYGQGELPFAPTPDP